jgi:putative transposase
MPTHSVKLCWLHLIWGTKERYGYFTSVNSRLECLKIIKDICLENGVYVKTGYVNSDHVHLLVDLAVDISIAQMMKLIKGISSRLLNEKLKGKFEWARGYAAFSVSAGSINEVVRYINDQEEHHRKIGFREEWENFMRHYELMQQKVTEKEVAEATLRCNHLGEPPNEFGG